LDGGDSIYDIELLLPRFGISLQLPTTQASYIRYHVYDENLTAFVQELRTRTPLDDLVAQLQSVNINISLLGSNTLDEVDEPLEPLIEYIRSLVLGIFPILIAEGIVFINVSVLEHDLPLSTTEASLQDSSSARQQAL
jgi:hypothetical protein